MNAWGNRSLRLLPSRSGADRSEPEGLRVDAAGRLRSVVDLDSVRQSLLLLLATRPGERLMRPHYGCELHRILFQPNDATTAGLAIHYVRRAIERWEPRIEVLRLDANPHPDDPTVLIVEIEYVQRRTGATDHLAVPVSLSGEAIP